MKYELKITDEHGNEHLYNVVRVCVVGAVVPAFKAVNELSCTPCINIVSQMPLFFNTMLCI
jgi:hypothetical protein